MNYFEYFHHLSQYVFPIVFALICGCLSYLLKVEEGKPFKLSEFVLHAIISAVCGFISFTLMRYLGFPDEFCGSVSGLAGWMGTRGLRIAEIFFRKRIGITKEDLTK